MSSNAELEFEPCAQCDCKADCISYGDCMQEIPDIEEVAFDDRERARDMNDTFWRGRG